MIVYMSFRVRTPSSGWRPRRQGREQKCGFKNPTSAHGRRERERGLKKPTKIGNQEAGGAPLGVLADETINVGVSSQSRRSIRTRGYRIGKTRAQPDATSPRGCVVSTNQRAYLAGMATVSSRPSRVLTSRTR